MYTTLEFITHNDDIYILELDLLRKAYRIIVPNKGSFSNFTFQNKGFDEFDLEHEVE